MVRVHYGYASRQPTGNRDPAKPQGLEQAASAESRIAWVPLPCCQAERQTVPHGGPLLPDPRRRGVWHTIFCTLPRVLHQNDADCGTARADPLRRLLPAW